MFLRDGIKDLADPENDLYRLTIENRRFDSEELSDFDLLTNLSLYNCQINALQGNTFPQITNLSIQFKTKNNFKDLTFIPNIFPELKNLKISAVANIEDLFYTLSNLERIRSLEIENCDLSEIPKEIYELKSLQSLTIKKAQLEEIPVSIRQLKKVEILCFSDNSIEKISPSIVKLAHLRKLLLNKNKLSKTPKLENLERLMELDLSENKFTSIPTTVFRCKQLTLLQLSTNPIRKFPINIGNAPILRKLFLSNCQLQKLPAKLSQFTNLRELDLSQNQLTSFPSVVLKLPHLETLFLSNNSISKLPNTIGKSQNLRRLYFEGNQLSSLPLSFGNLKNLYSVDLERNNFTDFPTNILKLLTTSFSGLPYKKFHKYFVEKMGEIDNPSQKLMDSAFQIIKKEQPKIKLSWKNWGLLLHIDMPLLFEKTRSLILENRPKTQRLQPFTTVSKLYVLGDLSIPNPNWSYLLGQANIQQTTVFEESTHLLLCKKPPLDLFEKIKSSAITLLCEKDMYDYLFQQNPPFLLQKENKEMAINLENLYTSNIQENKEIAILTMQNGGVPPSLKTHLICEAYAINDHPSHPLALDLCRIYLTKGQLETAQYLWGFWLEQYALPSSISLQKLEELCNINGLDFEILNTYYKRITKSLPV